MHTPIWVGWSNIIDFCIIYLQYLPFEAQTVIKGAFNFKYQRCISFSTNQKEKDINVQNHIFLCLALLQNPDVVHKVDNLLHSDSDVLRDVLDSE